MPSGKRPDPATARSGARKLTTKTQRTGYRLMIRRIENAFVRREVGELGVTPFSAQTMAFGIGALLTFAVLGFVLLMSFFSPNASRKNASIIITRDGGRYVVFEGQRHSVTNLASARLIVGKAEQPKIVSNSELETIPPGETMGIALGPDDLTPRNDDAAVWTVCDYHTDADALSMTGKSDRKTFLLAGEDAVTDAVTEPSRDEAVLIRQKDAPGRLWMVYNGYKEEIWAADNVTRHILGVTHDAERQATFVSQGLMDALPSSPPLTTPFIPDRGVVNPGIPEALTGDVVVSRDTVGKRTFFLLLPDGVQEIPELLADLLSGTGSNFINRVDSKKLASLTRVSPIDTARYPEHPPKFITPHTLCWQWKRGVDDVKATTRILAGESIPLPEKYKNNLVSLVPAKGSIVQADATFTRPGKGWYVQVTGDDVDSPIREQLMWIADTGWRYIIGRDDSRKYDKTLKSLGLESSKMYLIPWNIAKLYSAGSTLSQYNALVKIGSDPAFANQVSVDPQMESEEDEDED